MYKLIKLIFVATGYDGGIDVSNVKRKPLFFDGLTFLDLNHGRISGDCAKETIHSHFIYLAIRGVQEV